MVGVGKLLYINLCVPQDRYQDAHFLLGRFEVKVGGSLVVTRAVSDFTRSGRAACLDGGIYSHRYPVPLT